MDRKYREQFGKRLLPSHRRAMQDINQCRTAARGRQLYFCQQWHERKARFNFGSDTEYRR